MDNQYKAHMSKEESLQQEPQYLGSFLTYLAAPCHGVEADQSFVQRFLKFQVLRFIYWHQQRYRQDRRCVKCVEASKAICIPPVGSEAWSLEQRFVDV